MSDKVIVKSSGSGIGFLGALAILFIALKLLNQITWSWWLVLSPIWIPFAIILVVLLVIGGIMLFATRKYYW